jgi:hypothetical protein
MSNSSTHSSVPWEKLPNASNDKQLLTEVKYYGAKRKRVYRYTCMSCNAFFTARKAYNTHTHAPEPSLCTKRTTGEPTQLDIESVDLLGN